MSDPSDSPPSTSSSSSSSSSPPPQPEVTTGGTTFLKAVDRESFRLLVQKYTGVGDAATGKLPVTSRAVGGSGRIATDAPPRKALHRLHERRQRGGRDAKEMMKLEIKQNPVVFKRNGASPRLGNGVSPLAKELLQSPVTPFFALSLDSSPSVSSADQQTPNLSIDFAGQDCRDGGLSQRCSDFPHIVNQHRGKSEPELLILFPLTSPRISS